MNFVPNLLKLESYFCLFLFDGFLKFIEVVSFFPEEDSITRVAFDRMEFKPKLNIHTKKPQLIDDHLLNVDVLESIRVVNQS